MKIKNKHSVKGFKYSMCPDCVHMKCSFHDPRPGQIGCVIYGTNHKVPG